MHRYRVWMHSAPSPGATYYDGYVDVTADNEEEATGRALRRLRQTHPDYPASCWRVDLIERLS